MFPEGRILDFAIVGVIALIVVGPKDLPILMRRVGQAVAKMRAMAAEFRVSFDEMARQSELDDLRREVEAMRSGNTLRSAIGLGPNDHAGRVLDDINHDLTQTHGLTRNPEPAQTDEPAQPDAQPDLPFGDQHMPLPRAVIEPEHGGQDTDLADKAAS